MTAWAKNLEAAPPNEVSLLPEGQRVLSVVCGTGGLLAWIFVGSTQLPGLELPQWLALSTALVATGLVAWALHRPSPTNLQVGIAALTAVLIEVMFDARDRDLFGLYGPDDGESTLPLVALGLVVSAAAAMVISLRRRHAESLRSHGGALHDAAGVLVPVAVTLSAMVVLAAILRASVPDLRVASSLQQAGWSVTSAVAALGLIVAGLRLDRPVWRKLALLALFGVAAKVVFVDLARVELAWR